MIFELDGTQKEAIKAICDWFVKRDKKYFVLAGRAGTGKSSIVRNAVENLALGEGELAFIAPTGKASMVMRKKGIPSATTMHKLIYIPIEKNDKEETAKIPLFNFPKIKDIVDSINDGVPVEEALQDSKNEAVASSNKNKMIQDLKNNVTFKKRLKEEIRDFKLIICDEASLLNDEQIADLESYDIPVIYIGDHHQLPPVDGSNSRISSPDFVLETIHRQDGDSGIIKLASSILDTNEAVRNITRFSNDFSDENEDVEFIGIDEFINDFPYFALEYPDQIICSTNRLKDAINACCRTVVGHKGAIPVIGDRLMCTRNNYEKSLINGLQGVVQDILDVDMSKAGMTINFLTENEELFKDIRVSLIPFFPPGTFNESLLNYQKKSKAAIDYFDFGYACTVHKSQGSEWDKVLYVQSFSHASILRSMHYTAVTRAAKSIKITDMLNNDAIAELEFRGRDK